MSSFIFLLVSSCITLSNAQITAWVVGVYTGEIGSDAEVKIKLHGDRGSSEFLKLDDNRDNYVSNRWEYYPITTPVHDIGRLESVQFILGSGRWSLGDVVVINVDTGDVVYCKPDSSYISSGIPVTLHCVPSRNPVYLLAISTGAAASDNMAYVKLVGDQGSTDFIAVDNIAIDNWEPHSTDFITIYPSDYTTRLGEVTDIQIKTDSSSDWDLEGIVLFELDADTLKPKCASEWIVCDYSGVPALGQTSADSCMKMSPAILAAQLGH